MLIYNEFLVVLMTTDTECCEEEDARYYVGTVVWMASRTWGLNNCTDNGSPKMVRLDESNCLE